MRSQCAGSQTELLNTPDKETGQRYVGSASAIPASRWATYATTLHGGNVGLRELVEAKGEEYYRINMRFAFLEYWSMRTDDAHVLEREGSLRTRSGPAICSRSIPTP